MSHEEAEDPHYWGRHLTSRVRYVDALTSVYRLCAERERAPSSRFETSRRVVIVEMGEGMLARFGESIAEGVIAMDPILSSANVSFTQMLERGDMGADPEVYCSAVDARMEEVAAAVRKERLCRFLLSPHNAGNLSDPTASISASSNCSSSFAINSTTSTSGTSFAMSSASSLGVAVEPRADTEGSD